MLINKNTLLIIDNLLIKEQPIISFFLYLIFEIVILNTEWKKRLGIKLRQENYI